MATLVVSPSASPLESPRAALSNFHDEQAETIALVDDLLTVWSAQQSQTASLDRQLHSDEPSSYPFPYLSDWAHPVSGIPYFEGLQDAASGGIPLWDFDFLYGDSGQIPLIPADNRHDISIDIPLAKLADDGIGLTQPLSPNSLPSEGASTDSADTGTELHDQSFFSINNDMLLVQETSCQFAIGSVLCIPSYPGAKLLNTGTRTENPRQGATQSPPQSSQSQGFTSLFTPVSKTPMLPSMTVAGTTSSPGDEHNSNTSSRRKREKVKELQHNNKRQNRDATGAVIGAQFTLGHNKVIRQPYSEMDRAKTKATRKRGACEPCKANKKRCDRPESEYECCSKCISKVFTMPCFVAKIIDAELFRNKPSPKHPRSALRQTIFQSLTDICHYPQRQRPIIVNLTQGLGLQMLVVLARYNAMPGEATHRVWKKNGQAHRIEMPSYCIASMQDAQRHMLEYITNFRSVWLKHVLGSSNEITRSLFDQAQRFAAFSPNSTVSKALDLCAASRIIERDWRFCGGFQNLGIPIVDDDGANIIPITPMMDAQLDQIVIHSFLLPIRYTLLASLQYNMTSQSSQSSFFETFLTISVLLSHAEWLLTHSRRSALRVGSKTRYNYIPRAESYFHACNTLLAYWHHMCNGASLVEMNWKDEGPRKWAGLDGEQVEFLEDLKKKINLEGSRSMMRHLREENMYESELYWCHQLFFPNWKAGAKTVEEVTVTDLMN